MYISVISRSSYVYRGARNRMNLWCLLGFHNFLHKSGNQVSNVFNEYIRYYDDNWDECKRCGKIINKKFTIKKIKKI